MSTPKNSARWDAPDPAASLRAQIDLAMQRWPLDSQAIANVVAAANRVGPTVRDGLTGLALKNKSHAKNAAMHLRRDAQIFQAICTLCNKEAGMLDARAEILPERNEEENMVWTPSKTKVGGAKPSLIINDGGALVVGNVKRISANGIEPNSVSAEHAEDPAQIEIDIARKWLRAFAVRTTTIRTSRSSYGLKHRVEDWSEARGVDAYVSNGAFIVAAIAEGFTCVRSKPRGINAHFNFSIRKTSKKRGGEP